MFRRSILADTGIGSDGSDRYVGRLKLILILRVILILVYISEVLLMTLTLIYLILMILITLILVSNLIDMRMHTQFNCIYIYTHITCVLHIVV